MGRYRTAIRTPRDLGNVARQNGCLDTRGGFHFLIDGYELLFVGDEVLHGDVPQAGQVDEESNGFNPEPPWRKSGIAQVIRNHGEQKNGAAGKDDSRPGGSRRAIPAQVSDDHQHRKDDEQHRGRIGCTARSMPDEIRGDSGGAPGGLHPNEPTETRFPSFTVRDLEEQQRGRDDDVGDDAVEITPGRRGRSEEYMRNAVAVDRAQPVQAHEQAEPQQRPILRLQAQKVNRYRRQAGKEHQQAEDKGAHVGTEQNPQLLLCRRHEDAMMARLCTTPCPPACAASHRWPAGRPRSRRWSSKPDPWNPYSQRRCAAWVAAPPGSVSCKSPAWP